MDDVKASKCYVSDMCIQYKVGKESKIVSEYDQEIPQSQTADNPVAPRGRAAQSCEIDTINPPDPGYHMGK